MNKNIIMGVVIMSKVYDFMKVCGVFYVLTLNHGAPAGRPFGAVMEQEGKLYFSTTNDKAVYQQILDNPVVQIIALDLPTRRWIRVSGTAIVCRELTMKEKMLEAEPRLRKRFGTADNPLFVLFGFSIENAELHSDCGVEKIQ